MPKRAQRPTPEHDQAAEVSQARRAHKMAAGRGFPDCRGRRSTTRRNPNFTVVTVIHASRVGRERG